MRAVDYLGLALGIFGVILTGIGTYLTYITYISPWSRFLGYLKKTKNWEKIIPEPNLTIFRYISQPGFQIIMDWDKSIVENFHEDWLKSYPDDLHHTSYYARMYVNGIFVNQELFVSLDGARGFVPVPTQDFSSKKPEYYYTTTQLMLFKIIGSLPRADEDSLETFAKNQKIPIEIRKA